MCIFDDEIRIRSPYIVEERVRQGLAVNDSKRDFSPISTQGNCQVVEQIQKFGVIGVRVAGGWRDLVIERRGDIANQQFHCSFAASGQTRGLLHGWLPSLCGWINNNQDMADSIHGYTRENYRRLRLIRT